MFGELFKQVTKTAADISNGIINGATDVTETFTGKNAITRTVRRAGNGVVNETKDFVDGIVEIGESAFTGRYRDDAEPQRAENAQAEEKVQPEGER